VWRGKIIRTSYCNAAFAANDRLVGTLGLLERLLNEYMGLYVINAIQEVIRAYGAQCTLDSFSFNAKGGLQCPSLRGCAHR
jgi:hypothetical protein